RGEELADVSLWIGLRVEMQAGIEHHRALWVTNQVCADRHLRHALATREKEAERHREVTDFDRKQLDGQIWLPSHDADVRSQSWPKAPPQRPVVGRRRVPRRASPAGHSERRADPRRVGEEPAPTRGRPMLVKRRPAVLVVAALGALGTGCGEGDSRADGAPVGPLGAPPATPRITRPLEPGDPGFVPVTAVSAGEVEEACPDSL